MSRPWKTPTRPLFMPHPVRNADLVPTRSAELARITARTPIVSPRPNPWPARAGWALAALASLAALAGVVWVAVQAVIELVALARAVWAWLTDWWPAIGGVVLALLLLWAKVSIEAKCSGLHCGGCSR